MRGAGAAGRGGKRAMVSEDLEAVRLGTVINRIALGPVDLERLAVLDEQTAREALAHFAEENWRRSPLAITLLSTALSLREAGLRPAAPMVEAMARFVTARGSRPANGTHDHAEATR